MARGTRPIDLEFFNLGKEYLVIIVTATLLDGDFTIGVRLISIEGTLQYVLIVRPTPAVPERGNIKAIYIR